MWRHAFSSRLGNVYVIDNDTKPLPEEITSLKYIIYRSLCHSPEVNTTGSGYAWYIDPCCDLNNQFDVPPMYVAVARELKKTVISYLDSI